MTIEQWLDNIYATNNMCADYQGLVKKAKSIKQIFELILTSDGLSYLCEVQERGIDLPYSLITDGFKNYINGKLVYEHTIDGEPAFTTTLYCCYNNPICVNTTGVCLLNCNSTIEISPFNVAKIYIDRNCDIKVVCPSTSKCIIVRYGDAKINVLEGDGKVKIIKGDSNNG